MNALGLITARGGSKGIPGKNVKPLAGKPLIAWTIEAAKASTRLKRVLVSTDDAEIARIALEWGAEVPFMRPAELAQDDSPHILALEHALCWIRANQGALPDYLVTLQPTSPLRTAEDIDGAIELAERSKALAVVSVCAAHSHPYLCMKIQEDGTISRFIDSNLEYLRRQDMPKAFVLNGAVYVNHCETLLKEHNTLPKGTLAYVMPVERSLDLDTEWDFYLAEKILYDRLQ